MQHLCPQYRDWSPSPWDPPGLPLESRYAHLGDWYVAPVFRTRDTPEHSSEAVNFDVVREALNQRGIEYEQHQIEHWGPGWIDILLVRPTDVAREYLAQVAASLEDNIVLSDDLLSERKAKVAFETWDTATIRDRAYYSQDANLPVIALRHPLGRLSQDYPDAYHLIWERLL